MLLSLGLFFLERLFVWSVSDSLLILAFYFKKIQLLKNKNNVLLLGGTKSVIYFTEKTTEVMEGEQNKRLCKLRVYEE